MKAMQKHVEKCHMPNGRLEMGAKKVDETLWGGAHAEGWRVREAFAGSYVLEEDPYFQTSKKVIRVNNPWMYVAPNDVLRFRSRKEAVQYHRAATQDFRNSFAFEERFELRPRARGGSRTRVTFSR